MDVQIVDDFNVFVNGKVVYYGNSRKDAQKYINKNYPELNFDEFGGFITRDGRPIGFNYDTEKVARERFDFSKLKQIGKGSDRTIFDLGNGKVLKVAHTARGLEQNIYEGDFYLSDDGIIPKAHERGLNYVVVDNISGWGKGLEDFRLNGMLAEFKKFSQIDFDNRTEGIQNVLEKYGFRSILNYDVLWGDFIAKSLPGILGATFNTLTTIFFMYFILYFMLVNARKMEDALYEYIPLHDKNVARLGKEVNKMVASNAIGIPMIAFAQGLVGLIGYLILGVKEPFFWFGVTCIAAMLPVVGAALAYVPLAIIFFANGQNWQGIAMLVFGFGIIGTIDNVLRFTLLKKLGDVHPLTTVFGVIIGLNLFGFIGLIFGPLLISLFMLLLRIYSSEFITKQRDIHKIMEN